MNPSNERDRPTTANQSRPMQLSEAMLRMNESLDLDNALRGARCGSASLTGASHAVITVLG